MRESTLRDIGRAFACLCTAGTFTRLGGADGAE
jgi:hypothetical protein